MSYRYFLALIFVLFINITIVWAETEPNDDADHADELTLYGSDSGTLGSGGDGVDWWKVTVPSEGKLIIATLSNAALEIDNYIYDQDKKTQLARYAYSGYHTWDTSFVGNVKPGTYYIKTYDYDGYGSYTITSNFIPAKFDNDIEPNDSAQVAAVLKLNSSSTGHLGYHSLDYTDEIDWYKVTVPAEGKLVIATQSDNTLEIDNYIFDGDKKKQLAHYAYGGSHTWDTSFVSNVRPGTYYIKTYDYDGYGSYTITSSFIPAKLENDLEPNDSAKAAAPFTLNGNSTGHLGFYFLGYSDPEDWRQINVPSDGKLIIVSESDPTLEIDNYIYDSDGKKQLAAYAQGGTHTWDSSYVSNLSEGTFYTKAYCYSGYGSYTIRNSFIPARLPNDPEPNDSISASVGIIPNTIVTGHLGYYKNGNYDSKDYFTFNLTSAWDTVFVRTDSDPTLEMDLDLYNSKGSVIEHAGTYGTSELLIASNIPAGIYYVRAFYYSGYGSYALTFTNTRPANPLVVDVKEQAGAKVPASFGLLQNYPNPFNPVTKISYSLIDEGQTTLKVYDILGREVRTLVHEYKGKGIYSVEFNARELGSGIYIYCLKQNNNFQVKKMMVLK